MALSFPLAALERPQASEVGTVQRYHDDLTNKAVKDLRVTASQWPA
jgi:hypothetical protein